MGYYNNEGAWVEGNPPPAAPPRRPRQMRPAEERQNDPNPGVRRQARQQLREGSYDNDGNWTEPVPANREETLNDVGRQSVFGVREGVAGAVGAPGDARQVFNSVAAWAIEQAMRLGGHEVSPETARTMASVLPNGADVIGAASPQVGLQMRQSQGSEAYNEQLDEVFGERTEPETTAGEYARTIGRYAPNALAPGGVLTRTARVVLPGAAEETAGQVTEGTEAEPYARLAASLGTSIISEGLISVLTRRGLTADERGLRLIMRELEDQGMSHDEIVRQANILTRQAPTEEVIAEVLGPGGLRLARAVAALGRGSGRSIAEETLSRRAEGGRAPHPTSSSPNQTRAVTSLRDRVMDETTRMTAPAQNRAPRSYWDALEALRTARAGQGSDAYRAMYAQQPDQAAVQSQILPALADGPVDAAASGARQLETNANGLRFQRSAAQARNAPAEEIKALDDELADTVAAQRQLERIASREMPNALNSRAIDYYQRGLQQMERAAGMGSPEARALGDARRGFNQMADEIVPGFRDARTRYGDSMRIEESMNNGRRVFELSDGEIERVMRGPSGGGLPLEEFDGFMLGVLDAIERKLGQGDTAFLARLMRNQNWRNQITRAVGGAPQAKRFFSRLAREANMQSTRNYVQRGSQTTPIAEDIAALTADESELAFMSDNARRLIASGGQVRPLVIRWVLGAFERFNRPGLRDPAVQEALARRLFARVSRSNAKELRDALNQLQTDQSVSPEVRNWLQRVTAAESVWQGMDDEAPAESEEQTSASGADSLVTAYREARAEAGNAPEGNVVTYEQDGQNRTIVESNGRFWVGDRDFDTIEQAEAYARFLAARAPIDPQAAVN